MSTIFWFVPEFLCFGSGWLFGYVRGFHKERSRLVKPMCVCQHWQNCHGEKDGARVGECKVSTSIGMECACREYTQNIYSRGK